MFQQIGDFKGFDMEPPDYTLAKRVDQVDTIHGSLKADEVTPEEFEIFQTYHGDGDCSTRITSQILKIKKIRVSSVVHELYWQLEEDYRNGFL